MDRVVFVFSDVSLAVEVMSVEVLDVEERVDSAVLICRISYKPGIIACLI